MRLYAARMPDTRFDVTALALGGNKSAITWGVHAHSDPGNATCERLFDPQSAALVWRLEGDVATKLGYRGCCEGLA